MKLEQHRLAEIVAKCLAVPVESIKPESNLTEDLSADSMDLVELLLTIEGETGIRVPGKSFAGIKTFEDLMATIERSGIQ